MLKKNIIVSNFVVAATVMAFTPAATSADEMALTLNGNGITILGDYVGYENNAYIISTSAGRVHVPSKYVTCEGDDCVVTLSANTAAAE